jgi:hypothetical protein
LLCKSFYIQGFLTVLRIVAAAGGTMHEVFCDEEE